jgi:FkbM family methyltransferase
LATDSRTALHQCAFSDTVGTGRLNINHFSPTNSLLASDERASCYWGDNLLNTAEQIDVEMRTINDFSVSHAISHIDILKIDVQGAEYAVLAGAKTMMQRQAISLIYLELILAPTYTGQHKLHEYLSFFDSVGYELFDVFNPIRTKNRLIQTDCLFVSHAFLDEYESRSATDSRP